MAHTISDGKVVQLSYSLTNKKGELLDRADRKEPFTYLHGASQIVPGLEGALSGLKTGDTKKVKVEAAEGLRRDRQGPSTDREAQPISCRRGIEAWNAI